MKFKEPITDQLYVYNKNIVKFFSSSISFFSLPPVLWEEGRKTFFTYLYLTKFLLIKNNTNSQDERV
ncbi:Uncharacterized protein APZ42_014906 [Daphnia magna]|uniref:Uncharacterized protein n=1 Tax=Daphnia magna TaxID=35525 RepID=A0A0P6A8D5_9CRUS|nr:Uncharacterized protein APZ42_014906 [Daphnia magna]